MFQIASFLSINRTIFTLYRTISVSNTKWDVILFWFHNDVKDVKSFFASAFQRTGYLVNKILVLTEYGCNKVVIEPRVMQFWSQIRLVISSRTRTTRSSDFEITRTISEQMHSTDLSTQFNYHYRSDKEEAFCMGYLKEISPCNRNFVRPIFSLSKNEI